MGVPHHTALKKRKKLLQERKILKKRLKNKRISVKMIIAKKPKSNLKIRNQRLRIMKKKKKRGAFKKNSKDCFFLNKILESESKKNGRPN